MRPLRYLAVTDGGGPVTRTMRAAAVAAVAAAVAVALSVCVPGAAAATFSSCESMWKTYPNGVQEMYFGATKAEMVVDAGYLRPAALSPTQFDKMPTGRKFWTKSWTRAPYDFLCGRKASPPAVPTNVTVTQVGSRDWTMRWQLADQPGGGIPDTYGMLRALRKYAVKFSKPVSGVRTYTVTFARKSFSPGTVYFACAETANGQACSDRAYLP